MNVNFARKISQTFNGRVEWKIPGGYFKLLSTPTAVDLELWSDETGRVLDAPSVEAGFYLKRGFDRVVITTPASQAVSWLAAPDEGGSDRLAGELSVVDGGKARTLVGTAYMAICGMGAGGAGLNSHGQLFNPVGSGIRVVVEGFSLSIAPAASSFLLGRNATALTTLVGTAPSKLSSGAGSTAERRTQANAGSLLTAPMMALDVPAATPYTWKFIEPVILKPGTGFAMLNQTVNQVIACNVEFFEEADV